MTARNPLIFLNGEIQGMDPANDYLKGKFNLGVRQDITVTSTVITVNGETSWVRIDATSTQTLNTINGGDDGDVILLVGKFGMSQVTMNKFGGNIFGGVSIVYTGASNMSLLFKAGSNWFEITGK